MPWAPPPSPSQPFISPSRRPIPAADLVSAAETFGGVLRDRPELYDGVRGINADVVARGLARVEDARTAMTAQERSPARPSAPRASAEETEEALRVHADELAEVTEIALADHPRLRERLGHLERS